MRLKLTLAVLALLATAGAVQAAPMPISSATAICDPNKPTNCIAPNADGSLNTSGGGSGGGNAAASATGAAVPSSAGYTGFNSGGNLVGVSTSSPLPVSGNVGGLETAGSAVTGGVLRVGGSDGALARDLLTDTTGALKLAAGTNLLGKVGIDQTTPGTSNGVAISGVDQSGNPERVATQTTGVLDTPRSSVGSRVVTRTAVSASTSTTVCPAQANVVALTLFLPVSGTGVGWAGQALTTATPGTATTTPEFATAAANATWTPVVPPTNLITVYSGTAFTAVCVQDVKQ